MKADHAPMTKPGDLYGAEGCASCGQPLRIVSLWALQKHFFAHVPATRPTPNVDSGLGTASGEPSASTGSPALRARAEPSPALSFPPVGMGLGVDGSAGSPRGGSASPGD